MDFYNLYTDQKVRSDSRVIFNLVILLFFGVFILFISNSIPLCLLLEAAFLFQTIRTIKVLNEIQRREF